ncbi:MAG TPA: M28 family peptidase [Thermomicrobiaceae bacterium]|nr:M28 family peptidase [Thermomicrobiaceae bacterium]
MAKAVSAVVDEVSGEELMRHERNIAQYIRLSGSPAEAKAFDYIQGQLEQFGYTVHRYQCEALIGYPEHARLQVTLAGGEPVDVACNGYSLSPATGDEGVTGELVYIGAGHAVDYIGKDVDGKIVISDGLAMPDKALEAQRHGAAGAIHINDEHIHEMCISPVWGTAIPETADLLPTVPAVAVRRPDGERLKAALAAGAVTARLTTQPYRAWTLIPTLTAELPGQREDTFVMFSGHVDSWHYGAMDNGTANSTQLEVARILAQHRDELRRGVRFCFWSGHSHGRYASSSWYADAFWHDLHERCVCHVNIDSVGAIDAIILSEAPTMAETLGFAREVLGDQLGIQLDYKRMSRSSDQSFWGHGIPSCLAALSEQSAENDESETFKALSSLLGGGAKGAGLGWWWHTTEDLLDKINVDFLVRDCRVYAETVYQLCTRERLPFDYAAAADEIADALDRYQARAGGAFSLTAARELAGELAQRLRALDLDAAGAARANTLLMRLGRILIPVNYTWHGPFEQDLALGTRPLPGLAGVDEIGTLDKTSDDYRFLRTRLTRERNRVEHALRAALAEVRAFQQPAG